MEWRQRRVAEMLDRRDFMKTCSGMGLAGTLFPGVLWAQAQAQGGAKITKEMIDNAAAIADVTIVDEYKEMMLEDLNDHAKGYQEIYKLKIPNSVDPAVVFDPVLPGMKFETERKPLRISEARLPKGFEDFGKAGLRPNYEALAFASVRELAELMRTKRISSQALTQMYLQRLSRYDATLKFTVTLTEERALAQAKKADAEIASGKYRAPDPTYCLDGRVLVRRLSPNDFKIEAKQEDDDGGKAAKKKAADVEQENPKAVERPALVDADRLFDMGRDLAAIHRGTPGSHEAITADLDRRKAGWLRANVKTASRAVRKDFAKWKAHWAKQADEAA